MANQIMDPWVITLLTISLAMLLEWLAPLPEQYHPLTVFRLAAKNMAKKVNPSDGRGNGQQLLSGLLALLVLVTPLFIILYLLRSIVEVGELFELLLLILAINFQPTIIACKQLLKAVSKEQKTLAREILSRWVLRECENLSSMGICKAAIETLILRFSSQVVTTIVIFLLTNGVVAIVYRLILELAMQWNRKLPQFRYFAAVVGFVSDILNWFSGRLLSFLIAFLGGFSGYFRLLFKGRGFWRFNTSNSLLAATSCYLKTDLGGAAFYAGNKLRRPTFNMQRPPEAAIVNSAIVLISQLRVFLLVLFSGVAAALLLVS